MRGYVFIMKWLVLLLALTNCAPDVAEAISLKAIGRGRPGTFSAGKARTFTNTYATSWDAAGEAGSTVTDPWSGNYTQLSVSFWYKTTGATIGSRFLMAKTSSREFEIRNNSSTYHILRFVPGNSTSMYCETDANRLGTDWGHYLVVFDGSGTGNAGRCFIYVNGVDRTTTYNGTIPASITDSGGPIYINSSLSFGSGVGGTYDEIAIWRSNQAANVATIYNGGEPGDLTALSPYIWYRMGDDPTDDLVDPGNMKDVSGNGYNLTDLNLSDSGDKVTDVP